MSREIKYRAWDSELGCMWEMDEMAEDGFELAALGVKDSPMKFMQYTGLKGSKGVEIYEGDITQDNGGNIGHIVWTEDELGWLWLNEDEAQTPFSECKVIGNIYENPELLEPTP